MNKYKDIWNPVTDGFFASMPTDIWGESLDPLMLDLELHSKIQELYPNLLASSVLTNSPVPFNTLANLVYTKWYNEWLHLYDALTLTYDVAITSTSKTTVSRSEVEELFNTFNEGIQQSGNTSQNQSIQARDVRTGSVERNTSLSDTNKERLKHYYNITDVDKKRGRDVDRINRVDRDTKKDTNFEAFWNTKSGSKSDTHKDVGVGSSALIRANQDSGSYKDYDRKTNRFDNNSSNRLAQTGNTIYNKGTTDTMTKTGSESNSNTVTNERNETNTESYNKLTDNKYTDQITGTNNNEHIDKSNQNEGLNERTISETTEMEGSSPLRTFQALIAEEIALRLGEGGNFVDILIKCSIDEICSKYIKIDEDFNYFD